MTTRFLLIACIATALACSRAAAQTTMSSQATTPDTAAATRGMHIISAADRSFVRKASAANLAVVRLGKLALSQGTNSVVKAFGQRMITDHTAANRKLKVIASAQSLLLSSAPSPAAQRQYATMKGLADATFDHAYAKNAVQNYQEAIGLFERSYALQTLPTLKELLSLALRLPRG
jgi:putative membrane protein